MGSKRCKLGIHRIETTPLVQRIITGNRYEHCTRCGAMWECIYWMGQYMDKKRITLQN